MKLCRFSHWMTRPPCTPSIVPSQMEKKTKWLELWQSRLPPCVTHWKSSRQSATASTESLTLKAGDTLQDFLPPFFFLPTMHCRTECASLTGIEPISWRWARLTELTPTVHISVSESPENQCWAQQIYEPARSVSLLCYNNKDYRRSFPKTQTGQI